MTLTPQDVEKQVFRERRRGYDPEEVDRFLDEVSAALGQLIRERDQATRRADDLEYNSAGARESETLLRRTLMTAERTAEQTVADAEAEAERIREEARREASELIENAEQQAAEVRGSAEQQAAELRGSAEQEAAELRRAAEQEATELRRNLEEQTARENEIARSGADRVRRAVAELQEFREDYRDRVQTVIAEQLAALDRVGELPDIDPALEQVADLPSGEPHDGSSRPGA